MSRVAYATCEPRMPESEDDELSAEVLRARGVEVEFVAWDSGADWESFDLAVIRSPWDYGDRLSEFLAWADQVGPERLRNLPEVLRWNTDKTYLRQLQDDGVPIIETRWDVAPGDDIGSHDEWVVKPTVSAGSRDTARWATADEVYAHSAELVAAGRHSMTQPYVSSVDEDGETAMLYFGGAFSHAIRKGPMLRRGEGVHQDRDSREAITPRTATPEQRELSEHVLASTRSLLGLAAPPLYARIDLVAGDDGSPLLIELELTEPSLFLPQSGGGADRLIAAVVGA